MQKPLALGVIGHRDAIITEAIEQQISAFFENWWGKSSERPITLLSPLAIGADTKVAEIFLAQGAQTGRDYRLHVPLPMPVEAYKTTFSADDFAVFELLCQQADNVFTLPTDKAQSKREQFRQGARYLIENSRQTIVLWDGNPHGTMGGTADSVFYLQNGYFADDKSPLANPPVTWVSPFIIPCDRKT